MIRKTPRLRAAALAAATLAVTALGAGAAQATQVFSDNFNGENGGVAADPYTGFANFTVLSGAVTLNEGARCDGGAGGCVGLDGRGGGGGTEFEMSNGLNYGVGSVVTLTYDIAGNNHDCPACATDDEYEAGFVFSNIGETINDVTLDGIDVGPTVVSTGIDLFGTGFPLPFNDPWTTHTISFTATDVGTIKAHFRSFSTDGVGPLLDNVSVDVTGGGVPEPAGWALMILGFGATGAALRRRRTVVAA
ncbi:MAG TPA: PEPxxWA-CTERM sorting domain-containing protein [Phenylobacterium sp.]|jgi:hypothetical protein|uniref:PEPxxWA-CTERM sorting domain-containing protein n=1 Tax=Phenylobacterium sp. TaxID=1871053 RepID=UPI002CC4CCE6|nr:PEPxxWA-CTERM sorting domain-containing protein [Phenylobacterium sp.]HXA39338.1 PEPxxWA-CTERM sorting domain-containing protein [Phenylobacterium sp.]